jgi:hypothetical protein
MKVPAGAQVTPFALLAMRLRQNRKVGNFLYEGTLKLLDSISNFKTLIKKATAMTE